MVSSGKIAYSASAKQTYQAEVDSLMAKLNVALKNASRERQAQTMANSIVAAKKKDNPDMTKAEIKKANQTGSYCGSYRRWCKENAYRDYRS